MGQTSLLLLFSHVWLLETLWTTALHAFLPITISQSCSNACPLSQWHHPKSHPLSPPSPPAFNLSQHQGLHQCIVFFFIQGGQSIGASVSAAVLPMNIQDWFLLGLTDLISLQSKGLSRVFSNTTLQTHQFFGAQPSSQSNSHSIHDRRKNHSLD